MTLAYSVETDCSMLYSGSADNSIKVWELSTHACINSFNNHSSWVLCTALSDHGLLISGSCDKTIMVRDVTN